VLTNESEETIEVNPVDQFLIVYEPAGKDIYRGLAGTKDFDIISEGLGCERKPSVTDDGTAMYFVAENHNIYGVDLTKKPTSAQQLTSDRA
jgi:bacillolysin